MRINHNLMAMNTHRQLGIGTNQGAKAMEKLSSGYRINRAGDDAAGLAISEKMRGQIRGLNQASRNAQDGISLIQTAEGALNETHAILQRMRELTVQANNDTNTADDRSRIQEEITQLQTEVTDIATRTEFNSKKLIDGSLGAQYKDGTTTQAQLTAAGISIDLAGVASGSSLVFAVSGTDAIKVTVGGTTQTIATTDLTTMKAGDVLNFDKVGVKITFSANATATLFDGGDALTTGNSATIQIGANTNQTLSVSMGNMKASAIGNGTTGVNEVNVTDTTQTFTTRINILDGAINAVSAERSKLGAYQNRLEHTIKNLDTSSENLQAAESRIRDVDMAKEMTEFSKNNILQQAAQAMLAQANQAPQGVLGLLR